MLTSVPLELDSNPGEDMYVMQMYGAFATWGILLNNRRGRESSLVRLVSWLERKYMRIYNPQRRPRVLVIKCRIDSSQVAVDGSLHGELGCCLRAELKCPHSGPKTTIRITN
ncbi:hypothetical protein TNCV_3322491 [Trichonephila clavipes]|nr:hypothetical protein TNCV_3322491 [Trichonephila clavipes]